MTPYNLNYWRPLETSPTQCPRCHEEKLNVNIVCWLCFAELEAREEKRIHELLTTR